MTVQVRFYTDPACPWSWATEPSIRKLMVQFDKQLDWTFVMGGLARDVVATTGEVRPEQVHGRLIREWLRVADERLRSRPKQPATRSRSYAQRSPTRGG